MTFICDNCDSKVERAGEFTFVKKTDEIIWKGHLCHTCQVELVNGKPLEKFRSKNKN